MTDQMIPAGLTREEAQAVREWAELALTAWAPDKPVAKAARVVLAALPSPSRPTLADMTEEERGACLRMQCDTGPNRSVRGFIAEVHPGGCRVIERDTWEWLSCSDDMVTPRPDLARMEWPGDQEAAPALPEGWRLADHKKHGRVIVTRPDPDEEGEAAIIRTLPARPSRAVLTWCDSDELTYLDQGADQ